MNRSILFLCFIFALITACNNNAEETDNTALSIRPVKYITVGNNNQIGQESYTGLAKAQQTARLSFRVGGTVTNIPVKVGDLVRKGQTLATLDATDYQVSYNQSVANVQNSNAQIESAKAQLESAKANYIAAQSNYNRFEKLYETNSISLSDFEQAKSGYLSAEASYKAAQTQISAAEAGKQSSESMARSASNQINYTRIKAPFTGVISSINIEENEVVGQGSPVFELNSVGNPDVEVGVPENAISSNTDQQKVEVQFNSIPNHTFNGTVHEIGYSSLGSTYPVTIRLIDNDERIRPGMPASATFAFDKKAAKASLLVPPSAVGEDGDGNFVYVIEGNTNAYKCKKQVVQVGQLSDVGFEVMSGLKNGDKVASAGLNMLREGMEVRLYESEIK
ncbi:MAG: efflux RND transporter periplasmic adaptor subunit [Bacteroidota bacterium]